MDSKTTNLKELCKLIEKGVVSPDSVIKMMEHDVKQGYSSPEVLSSVVKVMTFIKYTQSIPKGEYIPMKKLLDFGIYESEEQLNKVINENFADMKQYIRSSPPVSCPTPTQAEINQNIYSVDPNKTCITCCRRRRHVIILPCAHAIMCSVCSKKMVERTDDVKCPMCRKPVDQIKKIFL